MDELSDDERSAKSRGQAAPTIFTLGYGALGFERFLELAVHSGITHLVDVRSTPGSKYWKDFCRPRLDELLEAGPVKYIYYGDRLGAKAVCRDVGADGHDPLPGMQRFEAALEKLISAAGNPNRRYCLMCGCSKPDQCHRGTMIGPKLLQMGYDLIHLYSTGEAVPQSRLQVGSTQNQESLFA